jgi:hypothetical protein
MKRLPIAILAGVVATTPALAATRSEHHFSLTFSAKKPGASTGVKFLTDRFNYKAPPQGQMADRVATVTFTMPPGTRTNLAAYPKCTRAALEAKGPQACPSGSKVGTGKATVITGLPIDPVTLTAQVFVKRAGLLAYLTGSGQTQVIEMSMSRNKIVAPVPRKCLVATDCSKGEAVLKTLTVTLQKGKLVKTPSTCPRSGKWTSSAVYKYVNGDSERETSTSPCKG